MVISMRIRKLFFAVAAAVMLTGCGGGKQEENATPTPVDIKDQETDITGDVTPEITPEATKEPTEAPEPTKAPTADNFLDLYKDDFYMGIALNPSDFNNWEEIKDTITANFNSFTCENEMKPDAVLRQKESQDGLADGSTYKDPVIDLSRSNAAILRALENDIKIRFHTLVWHAQTPRWFFTEDYTNEGEYVSREVMLARMESYIRQVLTYLDTEYPGLIYAVDVVNEAFNGPITDENPDGVVEKIDGTPNYWYDVLGADYVYYAFYYARQYAPDYMKLFYNDYNTFNKTERIIDGLKKIKEEGLIDGIGMQSHVSINDVMDMTLLPTVRAFCREGYEVQITEFDLGIGQDATEENLEKQARKLKSLMLGLQKLVNNGLNFTSMTFWGYTDRPASGGWRAGEHALLFDEEGNPKRAFYGVLQDESVLAIDF